MASLYLIISSIIFPVLAICWLCCIACCIYRSLIKALAKQGRTTKVQVGALITILCIYHIIGRNYMNFTP